MMASVEDPSATGPGWDTPGGATAPGWAVPGSAVAQPTAEPVGPDPTAVGPQDAAGPAPWPEPARSTPSVPRVALRAMTVADILDGAFGVVKARPRRILVITAAFVVPIQIVLAFLQRNAFGGIAAADFFSQDPAVVNEQSSQGGGEIVAFLAAIALSGLALAAVAACIAHLVAQWTMGRDPSAREMVGVVARRFWPLLASYVVVKLAEGAGAFACYVGILFVMPLFVPVAPIVAVEGTGPLEALSRSVRLVRPRYWFVMLIAVLSGVVAWLLTNALSALSQLLASWIGLDRAWPLLALGSTVAELVVVPFVAGATVLLYFDLRVRTEGLDIEMTAIDVLDRAA
jgi:hypothetical protein